MYHKSVPQIRQKLDKINHDIKSLIKTGDTVQIFHQSLLKFKCDLEAANKLKIVKIYVTPKPVQQILKFKERISNKKKHPDDNLAKEMEGFLICFEEHLAYLCDNRAELRYLLTDKTSRNSVDDARIEDEYPQVFSCFEKNSLRTRFLRESFVKACGKHSLLK
jgi:hypothetical protein